jgi:hypothetical protein
VKIITLDKIGERKGVDRFPVMVYSPIKFAPIWPYFDIQGNLVLHPSNNHDDINIMVMAPNLEHDMYSGNDNYEIALSDHNPPHVYVYIDGVG